MTTMHCTMEQLLALRGPDAATEPGHAAARDHLAGCVICQQEAARLDQRVARLKALPVLIPARDRFAELERRLVQERRTRRVRWAADGTAIVAAARKRYRERWNMRFSPGLRCPPGWRW